ncbi:MAG TPA: hypothetical protein VHB73_01715, partial [Alphaproteobacteria bacterium]|nr:hypothetical protein [Alphaproteobacteria bacterium]
LVVELSEFNPEAYPTLTITLRLKGLEAFEADIRASEPFVQIYPPPTKPGEKPHRLEFPGLFVTLKEGVYDVVVYGHEGHDPLMGFLYFQSEEFSDLSGPAFVRKFSAWAQEVAMDEDVFRPDMNAIFGQPNQPAAQESENSAVSPPSKPASKWPRLAQLGAALRRGWGRQ